MARCRTAPRTCAESKIAVVYFPPEAPTVMSEQPPEPLSTGRPIEEHLKSRSTWLRLVFMIVMALLYGLSRLVVTAVIILQFLHVLFTGQKNPSLVALGQSLATYTYQIVMYLTFVTEVRPFPFDADWPPGAP
jgi:hypothetical protein